MFGAEAGSVLARDPTLWPFCILVGDQVRSEVFSFRLEEATHGRR
jgi:hypothetical protein